MRAAGFWLTARWFLPTGSTHGLLVLRYRDCFRSPFLLLLGGRNHTRRLPRALPRRQNRRGLLFGPVKPHHQVDSVVRRRQPVGLLVLPRGVLLDIERQRAIGIGLHSRQHRRVDQVAIDRVFDQELGLAVVHSHRPEGIHRRQTALGKRDRVVVFAAVEGLSVGGDSGQRVHRL